MSKQTINIGASPNDGTGTPLRTSFDYTNQNFTELYTALGGGVGLPGASNQVIFNDGGTNLAGDSGLTFNKTTDTLSTARITTSGDAIVCSSTGDFYVGSTLTPQFKVERATGNATITGDLTVDTNVLKVDTTLNKVGIGVATLTGLSTLNVAGDVGITSDLVLKNSGGTAQGFIFGSSGLNYRVIASNPHVWQEGGTDLMRLNSTGLGVGASPSRKLSVSGAAAGLDVTDTTQSTRLRIRSSSASNFFIEALNSAESAYVTLRLNDTTQIDSSGNVGVGVTPSAWFSTWKVLQLAGGTFGGPSDRSFLLQNAFVNTSGQFEYISASSTPASYYRQLAGAHDWYTAAAGTSPNQITDFATAKMTLDASGRLGIGTASPTQILTIQGAANQAFLQANDSTAVYQAIYGVDSVAGGGVLGCISNHPVIFRVNNTEAMRLNTTGNLVLKGGTANANGVGVTFPATQVASSDANCLDDYEEGTWTPTQGAGLTVVGAFSSSGTYTKVGRLVTITGVVNGATSVAATSGNILCGGLPFSASVQSSGAAHNSSVNAGSICAVNVTDFYSISAIGATVSIRFSATYPV